MQIETNTLKTKKPIPRQDPQKKPSHHFNSLQSDTTPSHYTPDDDVYYAFTASDRFDSLSTVQVLNEDKLLEVVAGTGASYK